MSIWSVAAVGLFGCGLLCLSWLFPSWPVTAGLLCLAWLLSNWVVTAVAAGCCVWWPGLCPTGVWLLWRGSLAVATGAVSDLSCPQKKIRKCWTEGLSW